MRARLRGTELERFGVAGCAAQLLAHAEPTLNFHPDRPLASGELVVERLLHEGVYRSQFETGISNGGLTAYPGGERDQWEARLFGHAYQHFSKDAAERPKYGGLNLLQHADGAAPRFGSCYFTLHPRVLPRCSFTWGDSNQAQHVATHDHFSPVLAGLLSTLESEQGALGLSPFDVRQLAALWSTRFARASLPLAERALGRALDSYVELQVHGAVNLADDVVALTIDPAFGEGELGRLLTELCRKYGIALRVHPGFVLTPEQVPEDFRGPLMIPLSRYVTAAFTDGRPCFDASALGRAAVALRRARDDFAFLGSFDQALQCIKQLWHVLVRFGHTRLAHMQDGSVLKDTPR